VREIRDVLVAADPAGAATYRDRARRYLQALGTLDHVIARCIDEVPAPKRKLVTDHDAFGYFAHRYGLQIVGAVIPSQTTEAQPSAADVSDLVDLIRREHVAAVFPETSINPALAQTIARETGASSDEQLYGDTLGPAGSRGATYIGMEEANADSVVRGLTGGRRGCTFPRLR
jgi:ABC-type Zn uptake system ZnuABC Zn-binding protein ZnuA